MRCDVDLVQTKVRAQNHPVEWKHMRRIDRTGQKYGNLTVTGLAPSIGKHTYWFCSCSCGRGNAVASSNLSKTFSCGCGKESRRPSGVQLSHFGSLLPFGFIPKNQVPLGDRHIYPRGFWLC